MAKRSGTIVESPVGAREGMRPLDDSLPLKLLKARETIMDQFRPQLNAHGVTAQQWRVVRALVERGEMDAGDLARAVAIRMPSISRILKSLEKNGLVVKNRSQEDKRLVDVRITAQGRNLFRQMAPHSELVYRHIQNTMGEDGYRDLMNQLDELMEKFAKADSRGE
ncbi:MAG: homoprotocatechuate degradation operon regulator HpaR [Fimbriimonadaceae bacterium]|nr:homoprotocatechuate degradation operon regulator HpaR [Alphaproteobacteria bacterium]